MTNKITDEEANIIYNVCRISHLLNRRTDQLSGGEKQRIALASLLTAAPKLLLLDEPFSNLDTPHKNMMKAVVRDIGDILNITCLLVSHDPVDILSWAEEVMVMKDGMIIQKGTPEQVYKQPVNEYTAALFGTYNIVSIALIKELAELFDVKINGKDVCVRPEHFTIVKYSDGALKGKVNQVLFCGSYYETRSAGTTRYINGKNTPARYKRRRCHLPLFITRRCRLRLIDYCKKKCALPLCS